jgi:hypothetical protein
MQTIQEFLKNEYTFSFTGLTISGIVTLITIGFVATVAFIFTTLRRLNDAKKPTYGFLGKPLYQMAVVAVLGAGIIFAVYNNPDSSIDEASATQDVTIEFKYRLVDNTQSKKLVEFEIIPSVNNNEWGGESDTFDIFINASGKDDFGELLYDTSEANKAIFNKQLSEGDYEISITVVYSDSSSNFLETISL